MAYNRFDSKSVAAFSVIVRPRWGCRGEFRKKAFHIVSIGFGLGGKKRSNRSGMIDSTEASEGTPMVEAEPSGSLLLLV